MNQKALFFDIDGTLISETNQQMPESAVKALTLAKEKGHLTFINTGRPICFRPPALLRTPLSGWLCGCGTYIRYKEQTLLSRSIPHERGREIIRLLLECQAEMILEGIQDCYVSRVPSRSAHLRYTREHLNSFGLACTLFAEDEGFDFDKFVIFTDELTDLQRIFTNLRQDMDIIDRQNGFYEIVPKGYSKGTAIRYILKHFGLSEEDAYVFGDSSNDLTMFRSVPHTIAMEKHDPVLDPYTEYVTSSVEEDGILRAMEFYHLT